MHKIKKSKDSLSEFTKITVEFGTYNADTYEKLHDIVWYVRSRYQAKSVMASLASDTAPCFWSLTHQNNSSVNIELYFADPNDALMFTLSQ